jgi:serine/threonine protein kinase
MALMEASPSTVDAALVGGNSMPVLFDRYRILGLIGQGGMGTVYRGLHINLKRPVAIKTLRLDRLERSGAIVRFVREMELAGQLDHRHIVRATDGGESNGIYYLVMEYLEGCDLDKVLQQRKKLPPAEACELIRQAALGLAYAHSTLVHRDIKPSNLWLTPNGIVKVLDFGLAQHYETHRLGDQSADEATPQGFVIGTYDFLSPEQAAGGQVDARTDIYSLGCTLYKLVAGAAPFSGPRFSTPAEKILAHKELEISKTPHFDEIPPSVGSVIQRMMAKNPDDRFETAHEVATTLAELSRGSQVAGLAQVTQSFQPLPKVLPEELSRLSIQIAPNHAGSETKGPSQPTITLYLKITIIVGLAILAAVLAWLSTRPPVAVTPNPLVAIPPVREPQGPIDVDKLPAFKFHLLLKQKPLPLGIPVENRLRWIWHADDEVLDVKGPGSLLFSLGKTERFRWTFEVTANQMPWTGWCGVYWGYHPKPSEQFDPKDGIIGECQFMLLERTPEGAVPPLLPAMRMVRGTGKLIRDNSGETTLGRHTKGDIRSIPIPIVGERTFSITVDGPRLRNASFGPIELPELTTPENNAIFQNIRYDGEFGVLTRGHATTFSNAKFKAHSEK